MFDTYDHIFAERADSYQYAMVTWPFARRREFEAVIERLPKRAHAVLCDIPAGGGYLYGYLPPDDLRYIAVEPTEYFVSQCPVGKRAERRKAPMESLPLHRESVDFIVSLAGLHHAPDKLAIFKEMRRIIRTAGQLVIADVEAGTGADNFLNQFVNTHNSIGHVGVFFGPETAQELRLAGLEIERDELVTVPWSFDTANDMGSFCKSLFGIDRATVKEVIRGIDEFVGRSDGAGLVNMAWQLRYIVCRPAPAEIPH